jgi:hypothetical protein
MQAGKTQETNWSMRDDSEQEWDDGMEDSELAQNSASDLAKARKPYTITKQRENWTDEEHTLFIEGIGL